MPVKDSDWGFVGFVVFLCGVVGLVRYIYSEADDPVMFGIFCGCFVMGLRWMWRSL